MLPHNKRSTICSGQHNHKNQFSKNVYIILLKLCRMCARLGGFNKCTNCSLTQHKISHIIKTTKKVNPLYRINQYSLKNRQRAAARDFFHLRQPFVLVFSPDGKVRFLHLIQQIDLPSRLLRLLMIQFFG